MNIKELYNVYPVLEKIDKDNNGIIASRAIFKTLYSDEYISNNESSCQGVVFVIKGMIKIQKINKDGEETNLYNIKQGEFCHEALSCLSTLNSLNISGKAIQDSEIYIIPFDVVKKYLISRNDFLMYMYEDLYKKFSSIIENKEERMHESLESRIIKFIMDRNSKVVYATHSQLAFEIDSVREVVSRKLKVMERQGYIKLERGKIIVLKNLREFEGGNKNV
ncbi:Crp/Fnr family transcriptional regulator [Clostridium intestinale]|uniref:Crp family transcriptional regulator n=1 Tax=Clostridium intestinale URNW TaxID=1294142 RepID=U2N6J7_9CLOT|nr:Crp/Fnr family transcriptional regulator [Clostridium intestinale]ERK31132.1 Crp family transcriptional regulator [Clostridium intestinale URNW]